MRIAWGERRTLVILVNRSHASTNSSHRQAVESNADIAVLDVTVVGGVLTSWVSRGGGWAKATDCARAAMDEAR